MKYLKALFAITLAIAVSGCAGVTTFKTPAADQLLLGSTSKQQVLELLGPPHKQNDYIDSSNGIITETLTYNGRDPEAEAESVSEDVLMMKSLSLKFYRDILVGKNYGSTHKADSTDFDFAKAITIKKGFSKAQVLALMGTPTGEYIYPVIEQEGHYVYAYQNVEYRLSDGKIHEKSCLIKFNPQDIVLWVKLKKN